MWQGWSHIGGYERVVGEHSERDTYRGNTIENRGCLFIYWQASVVSETVLEVDNAKSGICYIYVCILFSPKNTAIQA